VLTDWPLQLPAGWKDTQPLASLSTGLKLADGARPPAEVEVIKGEWAGVRVSDSHDSSEAGPTGAPWVDSNGWTIRLARLRRPGKTVWVSCDPPKPNQVIPLRRRVLGLADAAAHGGRWIVPLPEDAGEAFQALLPAMRFFDAHREWADYQPRAVLAYLSDFSGDNEFLSHELLNLTPRRHLPYLILDKTRPVSFAGLKAVVYPDQEPPAAALRAALVDFARGGGLVMAGPKFGAEGRPAREQPTPRWDVRTLGKGRLALATADPDDPYVVANDVHILLSRHNDLLRFYNAGTCGAFLTVSGQGRQLLHLLNYSARAGQQATLWIAGRYRSVTLHTFDGSQALKVAPSRSGSEIYLPPVAVYAALEFEQV